jgi:hypothetical protein
MIRGAHTWPATSALLGGGMIIHKEESEEVPAIPEENMIQSLSKLQINNGPQIIREESFVQPEAQAGFAIFRFLGSNTFQTNIQN